MLMVAQLVVMEPGIQTHQVPQLLKTGLSPKSEASFDLICQEGGGSCRLVSLLEYYFPRLLVISESL